MDDAPTEAAHQALDELLGVAAKAADDLKFFHEAISRARLSPLPPFPRAAIMTTVRVVDHLKKAEQGLRDVMIALGLPESPRSNA
jgi:hypothetical protein